VRVRTLWLADFRSYESLELALHPGVTVVVGGNGQGKTNLVEAVGFLATLDSFRGAPLDALVRSGSSKAVVRAEVVHPDGREVLLEAELPATGRVRTLVNRQRLQRTRDLLGALRVSVFSPDDLALVKGGPAERRRFLDDAVVSVAPRLDAVRSEVDRVLRQRAALLRSAGGRLTSEIELTLDVWDAKLAAAGEQLADARAALVADLAGPVATATMSLAGESATVRLRYEPAWRATGLAAALAAARLDDLRRQVTTVGPHRDDLDVELHGLPARTHASQGEQRTLALALRLGAHLLVTDRVGMPPVLVLDDVFSELDPARARALLQHLPAGQVLLTTAVPLPPEARADRVVHLERGKILG
jgi:DNA replication and repair protein RecF